LIDRLLEAVLAIGAGLSIYHLVNVLRLRRRRGASLDLPGYTLGRPAIVYFSSPDCWPCKTEQNPALEATKRTFGPRLQVIEIDARRSPQRADQWGVLSLPTTFVVDAHGRPRRVNHGVARAEKLERQLIEVGERPMAG
jgi:thioredoxin-like negative regulator of GroEL